MHHGPASAVNPSGNATWPAENHMPLGRAFLLKSENLSKFESKTRTWKKLEVLFWRVPDSDNVCKPFCKWQVCHRIVKKTSGCCSEPPGLLFGTRAEAVFNWCFLWLGKPRLFSKWKVLDFQVRGIFQTFGGKPIELIPGGRHRGGELWPGQHPSERQGRGADGKTQWSADWKCSNEKESNKM